MGPFLRPRRSVLCIVGALLLSGALHGASTGQTQLQTPQGGGTATANGEYVSTTLNTSYHYFIEVPPGLSRLVVEVFDTDVGRGTNEDTAGRDRQRGGTWNTSTVYTLLRPDGSSAATLTCSNVNAANCVDNAWNTILNSPTAQNTAAGHWELRVDLSGSTGDDINAIGVRAHDGDSTSGGTELPVYLDSIGSFGVNPPASGGGSRSYPLYPYVTSGCTANENDFDYDGNSGTVGAVAFSSRTGSYTQTIASASLSGNDAWARNTINRWTSDQLSTEYGIWSATVTINTYTIGGVVNGNYTDLYVGSSSAAANPPTANPVTNGFRMYLPTDGGSAPVKPYVEQILTFKSGTNPVPVGQTAKYQVTIRVVNPTARPIVFSAANLVTASVPGGGATYAGNAAVGQGTVVSQPAVGGTGNITWNPGTVAAGATTILTYQVNVTPTSAGQRIPVTGTPASNGTTARYVDETGNTTQTRATFTFGPLCELAVTQNLLTQAVVSRFAAHPAEGGGAVVEWETAGEVGTAGFRLERRTAGAAWQPVGDGVVAGLQGAPQGGTYRLLDGGVQAGEPLVYRLVEIENGGSTRTYGPYATMVAPDAVPVPADGPRAEAHAAMRARLARRAGAKASTRPVVAAAAVEPGAGKSLWLGVGSTGLHRLPVAAIAAAAGRDAAQVARRIADGKLLLRLHGTQPVAWYPEMAGDGSATALLFYGVAEKSSFSAVTPYRLDLDTAGPRMATLAVGGAPAAPASGFETVARSERDLFAATVIAPDPASDYWFWVFLQGDDPTNGTRTLPLDAPGAVAGSAATLAVDLQGATSTGVTGEHQVAVALNGTALGSTSWTGLAAQRATFAVPGGVLLAQGNQVTLTATAGAGAPYSFSYVEGFDLDYQRGYAADAPALELTAGSAGATVTGLAGGQPVLLEISDPANPRWVTGAALQATGGTWQVGFTPAAAGRFLASGAPLAPQGVRRWRKASDRAGASLLVVTPAVLADAAGRFAAARRGDGVPTAVVTLDEIADTYGGGVASPDAVRAAIRTAALAPGGALRYVVLLGTGTYDYRDVLGYGDGLLPPWLVQTANGLFAGDPAYGDLDGDHVPEVIVGRIPALTPADVDAWIAREAAYAAQPDGTWASSSLLLADAPDRGADFARASDPLATALGAPAPQRIELGTMPLGDARAALFAGLASGASLVNYFGHGALDRLASGGLLTTADVPALANGSRLPLLTAMTCTVNRIEVPGIPSLGEALVRSPGGGAIAVLAPSAVVDHHVSAELAESVYAQAAARGDQRLGDWLLAAYRSFASRGGVTAPLDVYELLGDPSLRLRVAPPSPIPGGSTGE